MSGTVEMSTWRWHVKNTNIQKHTYANTRSHIIFLFLGTVCHWDWAVIKAYHWVLSTASVASLWNDSLLAWQLTDMDTLWTTWSPSKLTDLTETPTSSWCLILMKDTLKQTKKIWNPVPIVAWILLLLMTINRDWDRRASDNLLVYTH